MCTAIRQAVRRLTEAQQEVLEALGRSTTYSSVEAEQLMVLGLTEIGKGRFGEWARITEAGREFLAKHCTPEGRPGAAQAGLLLREATAREPTIVATNARSSAAILPPAAAQDVGASSTIQQRAVRPGSVSHPTAAAGSPFIAPRTRRGS